MMSVLIAPAPAVYARESWAEIIKSARMPQFIIPTIALPPAFYALFALAMGQGSAEMATRTLATFGVFAVMGPALFGFGANIAAERESGQLELKRTIFRSDHASNWLVLKGTLGADKERLLQQVRQAIAQPDAAHLRPAWARGL